MQISKIKRQEKFNAKLNKKALQTGDFVEKKKQEDSKSEDEWDTKKKYKNNSNSKQSEKKDKKKLEKVPSLSEVSSVDITDITLKDKSQQDFDPSRSIVRNKMIVSRLKELRFKRITQLLVYGSIVAMALIVYFVAQYLLFGSD